VERRGRPGSTIVCVVALIAVLAAAGAAAVAGRIPTALAAPLAVSTPVTALAPFNNEGISGDASPAAANFDGGGRSYSANALAAAGFAPGQSVTVGTYSFQWITPVAGTADNWQAAEQTIPFSTTSSSIAFLGASAGGNSSGVGYVRFGDGSVQSFTLAFSDWTLGGGGGTIAPGDTVAVVTPYRNSPSGPEAVKTYVFLTSISLSSGKSVVSITLPETVNQGSMHIFAVAAAPTTTTATVKGISNDSAPTTANLDGGGNSYSNNALDAAGLSAGALVGVYGFTVSWPAVAPAAHDDWGSYGAVVPLQGSGTSLEILGAAVGGAASGTATITYTDGTTSSFTLAFSDWTLGGGGAKQLSTNYVVAAMPYRNTPVGKQQVTTYVFATIVGLQPDKPLRSLTLPTIHTGGRLTVFAAAAGTASTPANLAAISSDATSTANFDGSGRSYSNNTLAAAGLPSGESVARDGIQFQWPTNAADTTDAWQSSGQVIPVVSTGTSLGFLGAASNGAASGTATITYTDGTTSSFTLAFSDWTLGGGSGQLLSGESIAAKMPYRNTPSGPEQVSTYVFFTSVSLTAGKTSQSVTLPSVVSGGNLSIFAVSGRTALSTAGSNAWPTYLENPAHTSFDAAETTLNTSNVGALVLKSTVHGQGGISDQPVFANGLMYWGSWDGVLHATNPAGTDMWTANLGQQSVAGCSPPTVGIASSVTIGSIGSVAAVFVAGGNHTVYALNAATGAVIWANTLAVTTDYFIWDSPVVFNNSLYIGISSFGSCPNSLGKLYRLDLSTGAIQNTMVLTSTTCPGDGVWGSPTVDVQTGVVYFVTGDGCNGDPNSNAVVAVSSGDLTLIDRWTVPVSQVTGGDIDFGSTPTLFTAVVGGVTTPMIGVANKDGYFYAFDRNKLSAGPLWSDLVAVGGESPETGDGSISPSAWDGSTLYVAAGNTTINGASCTSSLSAINPATGGFVWRQCLTSGPTLAAVLGSPGLVFVDSQTEVNVLNSATGAILFQFKDTSPASYFFSAPALNNGDLYAANTDGNLYIFGL
jgi:outer membrane protein assembly factor BamB